jgi:hypothetical protein
MQARACSAIRVRALVRSHYTACPIQGYSITQYAYRSLLLSLRLLGNTLIAESMSRIEIYRSRARKCAELAEAASDLVSRQYYLQLVGVWNDMARRVAQIEVPGVATLGFCDDSSKGIVTCTAPFAAPLPPTGSAMPHLVTASAVAVGV